MSASQNVSQEQAAAGAAFIVKLHGACWQEGAWLEITDVDGNSNPAGSEDAAQFFNNCPERLLWLSHQDGQTCRLVPSVQPFDNSRNLLTMR